MQTWWLEVGQSTLKTLKAMGELLTESATNYKMANVQNKSYNYI